MKLNVLLAGALALVVCPWLAPVAKAQVSNATVVASCGSQSLPAGQNRALSQSTGGQLCSAASVSASITTFRPTGQAAITAGTSTSRVALGSAGPTALVTNNGSVTEYVNFGDNTVTATTSSYPVNAGQSIAFDVGSNTYMAAITGSSTAATSVTTGTGLPAIANSGSGGGSGGNVNLTQVGGSAYALGSTTGSASMPVVIASDQAAVAVKQTTPSNLNATVVGAGTAGSPSGGVVSIQGVTSMTPLLVNGSGSTQPVSGTVTANAGSGTFTIAGAVTNAGTFAVQNTAATPAGTNVIGHVITDSGSPTVVTGTVTTQGSETAGSAVTGLGVRAMGSDGTNARDIKTDSAGNTINAPLSVTTTDKGGTVTSGGTAQTIIASNASRRGYCVTNSSANTDILYVRLNGTASATTGVPIAPGAQACNQAGLLDTSAVSLFGATTGDRFYAYEVQ